MKARDVMAIALTVTLFGVMAYAETASALVAQFEFVFGSTGTGNSQFNIPNDVDTDAADRIIVADRGNDRIQVFDANGNFAFSFPETQAGPPSELGVDKSTGDITDCQPLRRKRTL